MKRLLPLPVFLLALFSAPPAAAAPDLQASNIGIDMVLAQIATQSPQIDVMVSGASCVYVDWWQNDASNNMVRVFLTNTVGTTWTGFLPRNHAGVANVIVTAEDANGDSASARPPIVGSGGMGTYDIAERTGANETEAIGLTNQRYPDMYSWTTTASGTGNLDGNWYGVNVSRSTSVPQMISLRGTTITNNPALSGGTAGGFVRTRAKVLDGVGSIWFKARMANTNATDGTIAIDRITSKGTYPSISYGIKQVAEVTVPPSDAYNQWHQFHLILQDYPNGTADRAYYRIRNKSLTNAVLTAVSDWQIDLCDIVLTPLIPDVAILKDELDYNPGFPSVQDPISFHVTVTNLYKGAPAEFITPRLVWRQGETDEWHPVLMTNVAGRAVQGSGTYACMLTPDDGLTDGPFEYFYQTSFTGYTPSFKAIKDDGNDALNNVQNFKFGWEFSNVYKYLVHTNSWALMTDSAGYLSECRAPASYPDFYARYCNEAVKGSDDYATVAYSPDVVPGSPADVDNSGSWWGFTHRFDLFDLDEGWPNARSAWYATYTSTRETDYESRAMQIPANFPYLGFLAKDGVRRFRSLYTDIAAVTADWTNTAPSYLERSYPMQHVGDYTWQAIIHVTNAVDAYFSVTGACYAAEGATNFVDGPFEWLELNQEDTNINPPMSGELSVDPFTGATNHHELVRFPMVETGDWELVSNTVIPVVAVPTEVTGVFVGLVTDPAFYAEDYTNEQGQAILPTEDDVDYWFLKLTESEDVVVYYDDEGVPTNTVTNVVVTASDVMHNWLQDASGNWTRQDYGSFTAPPQVHGINSPNRVCVTNLNGTVVTDVVWEEGEPETHTNWVWVTSWVPVVDAPWAGENPALRSRVQIDYDGFLMYRFCTTNGAYQIRRAAWQDFNTWQADDRHYWRSAGLYDMKSFESDLEGARITPFETMYPTLSLDGMAASAVAERAPFPQETMDDWWSKASEGEYWNGLVGKNATFLLERMAANPTNKADTTRNGAILLNTYPKSEGTLQTSNVHCDDGRDTLAMRVRSHTADDRCITYATAESSSDGAQNYRVVARIRNQADGQVSDGEFALSLVGYYQGPGDFWEARIVQKSQLVPGTTSSGAAQQKNWFEVHLYKWVDYEAEEVFGGAVQHSNMRYHGESYTTTAAKPATWPGRYSNWNSNLYDQHAYKDGNAKYGQMETTEDGGWAFAFDLKTVGDEVYPSVYAIRQSQIANFNTNAHNHRVVYPKQSGGTTWGRPGFNLRDCGLKIAPYVYGLTDGELTKMRAWAKSGGNGYEIWSEVATSADAAWDHNKTGDYDRKHKIDVWETVAKGGDAKDNPSILTRKAPTVWFGVEVYRTQSETATNLFTAPIGQISGGRQAAWDDDWDAYHGHAADGVQSVASWRWQTVEFPMAFWDDAFLNIRAYSEHPDTGADSLALLAVDSMEVAEWRGKTVSDPEGSSSDIGWRATYAAVAQDPNSREGRVYELNRSRANPNRTGSSVRQGVTTPLLEKGVGDISFTYTVANHPVYVSVGVVDAYGTWIPYAEEELPVTEKPTPYYVYIATNLTGRIRVTTDDPSPACRTNGQLGTLYVDNLRATDYPAVGSTSWEVYNALVSTFPSNVSQRANLSERDLRKAKFDGVSDAVRNYRSAVLNDSRTQGTINNTPLDEYYPHLQTPTIETGIGEVSFWYRASDDNGRPPAKPAKIRLMAAESANVPAELWDELTVTNLYSDISENPDYPLQVAAMEGLSNVTNKNWTYFNVEFYEQNYRVLRVVADGAAVEAGDFNRVMLDNVLVTEPVRSSIDVGAFRFVPDIPVNTKDTDAEVTLVNPRMNPTEIQVWLDWYAAPGVVSNVAIETVSYAVRTNYAGPFYKPVELDDGRTVQAEYYIPNVWTEELRSVNETRYPGVLNKSGAERPWGYETWSNRWAGTMSGGSPIAGSIPMTNVPNTLVYCTSAPIPTSLMQPDMVLQYCVKVDYKGRFHEPVYSELQGEVKNGYRFENPPWYDPIDLNVPMGTTNKPVSYAFVFSCTTNVVFINEFRPAAKTTGPDTFVELMGPAGSSVANWRLEHYGTVANVLSPKRIAWTNIVEEGAKFVPANNGADPAVNKGWGFWVLASYRAAEDFADRDPAVATQELFPAEIADKNTSGPMTVPGAMRLRRSMGAYVDKVVWGQQNRVSAFLSDEEQFQWAGNLSSGTRSITKDDLKGNWNQTAAFTPGGYNEGEEDELPDLGGVPEPVRVPALLDPPEIEDIAFASDDLVRIRFKARLAAESVAEGLTAEPGDYTWTVDASSYVDDWDMAFHYTTADGTFQDEDGDPFEPVPTADGEWTRFDVFVPANSTVLFFRIRATPNE